MALRTWARLVRRHSAALPNSDECGCSAMAARRLLRARRRSAMRWRPSARLRAWTDFVLILQGYHASRSRKAGSWELLLPGRAGLEEAIQQTRRSALRSHGIGVGPPASALLWSSRLEDQTCRFFVRGLRHEWIGLKCQFGISRAWLCFARELGLLSVMADA